MTQKTKGAVKRVAGRVVEHTKVKHQIPRWVFYIVGILGVLAIIYGTIQQFRIMRWARLLEASKVRITELEKEKELAVLQTTKKLSERAVKISKEKLKDLDKKIDKAQKEKEKIQDDVRRMDPNKLKKGFKAEGF